MRFHWLFTIVPTFVASFFLVLTLGAATAYAEAEDLIAREPAQKKSEPAVSSSNSGGTNGDFINLRLGYLFLIISGLDLELDFKASANWTVGPTLYYRKYKLESTGYTGGGLDATVGALGVRATWSPNGAYRNGMYLAPILQLARAQLSGTPLSSGRQITGEARVPVLTGIIGYQWFGDGGFNAAVGAGLAIGGSAKATATDGVTTVESETSTTTGKVALDFTLGYVF